MMEPTNAGLVLYTVYAVLSIYLLVKLISMLPCGTHTEQEKPYRNYRRPRQARVMPAVRLAVRLGAARLGEMLMAEDNGRDPLEW